MMMMGVIIISFVLFFEHSVRRHYFLNWATPCDRCSKRPKMVHKSQELRLAVMGAFSRIALRPSPEALVKREMLEKMLLLLIFQMLRMKWR